MMKFRRILLHESYSYITLDPRDADADKQLIIAIKENNDNYFEECVSGPTKPFFDFKYDASDIIFNDFKFEQFKRERRNIGINIISKLYHVNPDTIIVFDSSFAYFISFRFVVQHIYHNSSYEIEQLLNDHNIKYFTTYTYGSRYSKYEFYLNVPYCVESPVYKNSFKLFHNNQLLELDQIDNLLSLLPTYIKDNQLITDLINRDTSNNNFSYLLPTIDDNDILRYKSHGTIPVQFKQYCIKLFLKIHPRAKEDMITLGSNNIINFRNIQEGSCLLCNHAHDHDVNYLIMDPENNTCYYACRKLQSSLFPYKKLLTTPVDTINPDECFYNHIHTLKSKNADIPTIKKYMLNCIYKVENSTVDLWIVKNSYGVKILETLPFTSASDNELFIKHDLYSPKKRLYRDIFAELFHSIDFAKNKYLNGGFYPIGPDENNPVNYFNTFSLSSYNKFIRYDIANNENISFIINHISSLCNFDQNYADYVLTWISNIIINPRQKQPLLVFISKPGAGKTMLMNLLDKLIRYTTSCVGIQSIIGRYNEHTLENTLLTVIDGGVHNLSEHDLDLFKYKITSECQIVESKYSPQKQIKSYTKFIVTSTDPECIIPYADNQHIVKITASDINIGNLSYFKKLNDIIESEQACAEIYHYFKKYQTECNVFSIPKPMPIMNNDIPNHVRFIISIIEDMRVHNESNMYYSGGELYAEFKKYCDMNNVKISITQRNLMTQLKSTFGIYRKTYRFGPRTIDRFRINIDNVSAVVEKMLNSDH